MILLGSWVYCFGGTNNINRHSRVRTQSKTIERWDCFQWAIVPLCVDEEKPLQMGLPECAAAILGNSSGEVLVLGGKNFGNKIETTVLRLCLETFTVK